jgi:hypothetical protein
MKFKNKQCHTIDTCYLITRDYYAKMQKLPDKLAHISYILHKMPIP